MEKYLILNLSIKSEYKMMQEKIKKIWEQLRKGILQMFGANVLNKIVAMVSNMIITRLLTKTEYGIYSYIFNIYSYLNLATGLGLISGAFQFGAENKGKKEEYQYYRFCLSAGLGIDMILISGFFIVCSFWKFSFPGAEKYLRIIVPMLLFEYIWNLLLTVLRCENRIQEYAKILNHNTILIACGTCFGAFFGIPGVLFGKYIAYTLSLLQTFWFTKKEAKKIYCAKKIPFKKTGNLWHYSIFTGISAALNTIIYLLDVSMIASMLKNPKEVAVYKVATLIPSALTFIPSSVVTCVLPDIVRNNRDYVWLQKNIKKYFMGLGAFNLVLCMGLILFAKGIITIISGEQYIKAVPAFQVLVSGYLISGTFRIFSTNVLAGLRYVEYGLCISITSLICDILFNYVFIHKFGMMGAAYATFGVMTVTSIMAFGYLIKKIYRRKI